MNVELLPVGPFQANCVVVWGDGRGAIVIDPGGDAEEILAVLRDRGLEVAVYLLTHGHVDHVSGLSDLVRAVPAVCRLHPADAAWTFSAENTMLPFYAAPEAPEQVEASLTEGTQWQDAGLDCRVIETPGHTPGSVCLHFPDARALVSGDTLFAGSVGRTDLPRGDSRALQASLARLADLPEETVVYPGHGPATTIGAERRANFFMRSAARRNGGKGAAQ
jgi:glyoxylase-like metal-dependent hydrolase (beta-lactamase superfamily II)